MKLSEKLKEIYTSGDTFTVLQLLDKLIKEVDKYEIEKTSMFVHKLRVGFRETGSVREIHITNTNPERMTINDILNDLAGGQIVKVYYNATDTVLSYYEGSTNLICTDVNLTTHARTTYTVNAILAQEVKAI